MVGQGHCWTEQLPGLLPQDPAFPVPANGWTPNASTQSVFPAKASAKASDTRSIRMVGKSQMGAHGERSGRGKGNPRAVFTALVNRGVIFDREFRCDLKNIFGRVKMLTRECLCTNQLSEDQRSGAIRSTVIGH